MIKGTFMRLSRRTLLASLPTALCLSAPAFAAHRHKSPASHHTRHPASTRVAKLAGTPMPVPPLFEPAAGTDWDLKATTGKHAFVEGKPADVTLYNGVYPGPTIRLQRQSTTRPRLVNALSRDTNLHWHGLLVDPQADAGQRRIAPGATWQTDLPIAQPAATLWYHEHLADSVSPDRPAGMMIIKDPAEAVPGLPLTYGVDDFPVILDDATLDADGQPAASLSPQEARIGARGATILVNGVTNALLKVPQRPVRLRLVNAARARVFRLYLDDERTFHYIAGDGGYLAHPVAIDTLNLAPGERAEIIVDFADGSTSLQSTPDNVTLRSGDDLTRQADVLERPFRVLAFDAVKTEGDKVATARPIPARLPALAIPPVPDNARHRRFEFAVAADGSGGTHIVATVNGKTFDPTRIDASVPCGHVEVWQLVASDMPHPIHIEGVQFHVLSELGARPRAWNRGAKDTVLVEKTVEIAVVYQMKASARLPYVMESAVPEHRIAGAAATIIAA